MRRILFVDHVNRVLGGAELNLIELAEQAVAEGQWRISCACAPGGKLAPALSGLGITIRSFAFDEGLNQLRAVGRAVHPGRWISGWRAMRRGREMLRKVILEEQPDWVVTCTNKDHLCAAPVCHRLNIPVVWWVNDIVSSDFFPRVARVGFLWHARRQASKLVCVSEFARRALLEQGLADSKVVTIHNGIPLGRYATTGPHEGGLHAQLGVSRDVPLVGIIGRLTPWKGQEFFLELAAASARSGIKAAFMIVGDAFNEDQAFAEGLRHRTSEPDLAGRVHFIPFANDVTGVLRELSLLVHASLRPEPFGRVLIEAMAARVPVLAARAGGVREIITDGVDGLLAEPGKLHDYAQRLTLLLASPQRRAELVTRAEVTVRERFTVERVWRDFTRLFEELAPARKGVVATK